MVGIFVLTSHIILVFSTPLPKRVASNYFQLKRVTTHTVWTWKFRNNQSWFKQKTADWRKEKEELHFSPCCSHFRYSGVMNSHWVGSLDLAERTLSICAGWVSSLFIETYKCVIIQYSEDEIQCCNTLLLQGLRKTCNKMGTEQLVTCWGSHCRGLYRTPGMASVNIHVS